MVRRDTRAVSPSVGSGRHSPGWAGYHAHAHAHAASPQHHSPSPALARVHSGGAAIGSTQRTLALRSPHNIATSTAALKEKAKKEWFWAAPVVAHDDESAGAASAVHVDGLTLRYNGTGAPRGRWRGVLGVAPTAHVAWQSETHGEQCVAVGLATTNVCRLSPPELAASNTPAPVEGDAQDNAYRSLIHRPSAPRAPQFGVAVAPDGTIYVLARRTPYATLLDPPAPADTLALAVNPEDHSFTVFVNHRAAYRSPANVCPPLTYHPYACFEGGGTAAVYMRRTPVPAAAASERGRQQTTTSAPRSTGRTATPQRDTPKKVLFTTPLAVGARGGSRTPRR